MTTSERILPIDPTQETIKSKALAERYFHEFVDLREVRIDHDLFTTIPVDLMFRYNFVPIHASNGSLEIALADPRNLNLIDELAVLVGKKLKVRVATLSQISDLLKASCRFYTDVPPAEVRVTLLHRGERQNRGELERMDRQRYAGPVGWIDADGNGEFGIALRCAQVMPDNGGFSQVRLFAGCGIVPDSDPDLEVAEAEAKLLPVREALEGVR